MNMNRNTSLSYANYVPIIQSSGTGKSRTADETARLLFTIPFNIRNPSESGIFLNDVFFLFFSSSIFKGYPVPDNEVRYFFEDTRIGPRTQIELCFVHFFNSLFRCVLQTLQRLKAEDTIDMGSTYKDLAANWRTYLQDRSIRDGLYREVIKVSLTVLDCFYWLNFS
jgi:hypothetical protein